MHPEDIKAELRKRHRTVKAFEVQAGLAKDSVRDVLRGKSSKRTAEAIATTLGKPLSKVFPNRFVNGQREHTSRKRDAHGLSAGQR
jgi:lambda repressor-like predicted transcriptional regulator